MRNPYQSYESLVGIVGYAASGKDTTARLFKNHGYSHISLGDMVREEIVSRGLIPSRELQTKIANQFRRDEAQGYWVDRALNKMEDKSSKIILSGIYSPGEGKYLVNDLGGVLVGIVLGEVDDPEVRYQRLVNRREGTRDILTKEEFMTAHLRENSGEEIYDANVSTLLELAQFTIYNSLGSKSLVDQVSNLIDCLGAQNG